MVKLVKFNNNAFMPRIASGIGTAWYQAQGDKADGLIKSVVEALNCGYTHVSIYLASTTNIKKVFFYNRSDL